MAGAGGADVGDGGGAVGAAAGPQAAIVNKRTNMTNGRYRFILSPSSENGSQAAKRRDVEAAAGSFVVGAVVRQLPLY
jgi:hypothetical protein